VIIESELSDEIQGEIFRPSADEAGYNVDLDFRKPEKSMGTSENGDVDGEVEFEVGAPEN
jgi:hypothetical protein